MKSDDERREHFASLILQGYASNPNIILSPPKLADVWRLADEMVRLSYSTKNKR